MNEIDKIKQLFNSDNEKLAFQLLEGIGYSKYDFIEEVYRENHIYKTGYYSSKIGSYKIWYVKQSNFEKIIYHVSDKDYLTESEHLTLIECLDEIIKQIENN